MKTATTGLLIFMLSWVLAFADSAWFGVHTYPKSATEDIFTAICVLVLGLGMWLMVVGLSKVKTA